MKAPRRSRGHRRSSLLVTGEGLNSRLARVEKLRGLRAGRLFVFMPRSRESKPAQFPEGEGPQPGDYVISFEPLHDTEEEARLSVEAYRERTCPAADLAPIPLPWKRNAGRDDSPPHRPSLDPELAQLAEPRTEPSVRPLTEDELSAAMGGLLKTGNLFHRAVVRNALGRRELPLGDERFPMAEFASSTAGTLLIRVWSHAADQARPRAATEEDRARWPAAFGRFLGQLSPLFRTPDDEDSQ